jgi:hypothetical protein
MSEEKLTAAVENVDQEQPEEPNLIGLAVDSNFSIICG